MALIIYPTEDYDSFVTEVDANAFIADYSLQSEIWLALTLPQRETYLRIATDRILDSISTDTTNPDGYLDEDEYVDTDSCLAKACSLMAVHDVAYGLSAEINPNTGLISKEKVGDLEVDYLHDYTKGKGRVTNPFPSSVVTCLNAHGAKVYSGSRGFYQTTLERS